MNKYNFRKNFTALFLDEEHLIRGKLAFKTKESHWLNTEHPIIALVSIDSSFHKRIDGDLKMNAFISTIKSCVKGKMTVLLADMAHLKAFSLKHQNNTEKALEECLKNANSLRERYRPYFDSCHVVNWKSYICEDKNYLPALRFMEDLFQNNHLFREHLLKDAEEAYTDKRAKEFVEREVFMKKTMEDILEQCTGLLVLSAKGYRFQFYPGRACASTAYLNESFIGRENQIFWVDVFLSIEKKTNTIYP